MEHLYKHTTLLLLNNMFTIEKNIPITKSSPGRKQGVSKYPFAEMEIGDSFLVPREKENSVNCISRRFLDKKFSMRKVEGGCRIWRIK